MKQTLFMVALTAIGVVGPFFEPVVGVAVYYLFAVLRPQFMWQWALPRGIEWSEYVAVATILGALVHTVLRSRERSARRFSPTHLLVLLFAV